MRGLVLVLVASTFSGMVGSRVENPYQVQLLQAEVPESDPKHRANRGCLRVYHKPETLLHRLFSSSFLGSL